MLATLPIEPPAKPTTWRRRRIGPIFAACLILAACLAINWYHTTTDLAELQQRGTSYTRSFLNPAARPFGGPVQPSAALASFLEDHLPPYLIPGETRLLRVIMGNADAPFLNRVSKASGNSQFDKIDTLIIRSSSLSSEDFAALRKATTLLKLDLAGTNFSDAELPYLQSPKLEFLILDQTLVTPAGLARMQQFPKLRLISVKNIPIPPELRSQIKARHPNVQFLW